METERSLLFSNPNGKCQFAQLDLEGHSLKPLGYYFFLACAF